MSKNENEKNRILMPTVTREHNIGRLLFCLLAFLLLVNLLPTVLPFEMRSTVINSLGAVKYENDPLLLVTDSTLEGPVPYKIDGNAGYQTGSNYSLSAGVYTIELPFQYSSPISNATYYFSHWQDDISTENSRTLILEPDSIVSLHGVYSTSPTPSPPSPNKDYTPPTNYLAHAGFENTLFWDGNYLPVGWAGLSDQYVGRVSDSSYEKSQGWTTDTVTPKFGDRMLAFCYKTPKAYPLCRLAIGSDGYSGGIYYWNLEYYLSTWVYLPSDMDLTSGEARAVEWASFWGLREFPLHSLHAMWYQPKNRPDQIYWNFAYLILEGGGTYWSETKQWWVDGEQYRIPLGRWWRFELYVHRHPTNGIFKCWITDPENPDPSLRNRTVLFEKTNCATKRDLNYSFTDYEATHAIKLYASCTYNPLKACLQYRDDLYVCDHYPYNDWTPQK